MASSNASLTMSSTESTPDFTTQFFHTDTAVENRDLAVNIAFGIIGLCVFLFNGSLLLNYIKNHPIRQYYSILMLNLFVFCTIHGLVAGIVFPLHRVNRYTHSDGLCALGVVIMEFCDNYILVLLPLLAIERLLDIMSIDSPQITVRKRRIYSLSAVVGAIVFTILYSLLPLIPGLGVSEAQRIDSSNPDVSASRSRFYKAFSCNGTINRRNTLSPVFMLTIQIICVIVTIGCFVAMFVHNRRYRYNTLLADQQQSQQTSLEGKRRMKAYRTALYISLLSATFILMTLPYGLLLNVRNSACSDGSTNQPEWCSYITLSLRFAFGILQHLGELFAPMWFAFYDVSIRRAYLNLITCKSSSNQQETADSGDDGLAMEKSERQATDHC